MANREELSLRLWIQIVRLANGLQKDVDRRLRKEFGQSLARFDVLSQLDRIDGHEMPVGQLSASLLTPNNNITRLLDRMERDGLLTRALSESDRRSFRVRATDEGLRVFRAMADENREWIARAFEGLGAERMDALSGALRDVEPDIQ